MDLTSIWEANHRRRQIAWDQIADSYGPYDWERATDEQLEEILRPLRGTWFSSKLCGVQREWLERRFENWQNNEPDSRLHHLDPSMTRVITIRPADEKRAKSQMGLMIGATAQIIGQEWGRMKRRAAGAPANQRKSAAQVRFLEEAFSEQPYPERRMKQAIAGELGLTEAQVEAWFSRERDQRGFIELNDNNTTGALSILEGGGGVRKGRPPRFVEAAREREADLREQVREEREGRREAEQELREARDGRLSVNGEVVMVQAAGSRESAFPALGLQVAPRDGPLARADLQSLLDTGNEAMTMISATFARHARVVPAAGRGIVIHGVNGRAEYPVARVRVEIRGFSKEINAAIGGDQGVLVGTDVLADMFRDGFTIADAGGGRANRRATTFWLVAAAPTASVGARRTHDSDDIENEPSAQRRRVW